MAKTNAQKCLDAGAFVAPRRGARVSALPPYWDGLYSTVATALRAAVVSYVSGSVSVVVPADPRRCAIGFQSNQGDAQTISVGPQADPRAYGWRISSLSQPVWFDLRTFGPLVTGVWYGDASINVRLMVYEIYALTPGQ